MGFKKANNIKVNQGLLDQRFEYSKSKGHSKQKWIEFCEHILRIKGLTITLYEARKTFSKYLTISDGKRRFKVRFSNHKPIKHREVKGDCDFFVGITNLSITRTEDALEAVYNFFNIKV